MKKSKSWIHVCVHFLLFMTLGVHLNTLGRVVNDIDREVPNLKQNIPKDYKIPIKYIPKETGQMCWGILNIVYLEESLSDLTEKFGNISTNKDKINTIILYLQDEILKINQKIDMEELMQAFMCHYREEKWEIEKYFDTVHQLYNAAKSENPEEQCDPPPCPSTTTLPEEEMSTVQPFMSYNLTTKEQEHSTRQAEDMPSPLRQVVEKSLFSLLFIPLLALIFLLVWKVRSRRNSDRPQSNPGEEHLFTPTLLLPAQLDCETDRNVLNICATV